jgi:hypothetical protein
VVFFSFHCIVLLFRISYYILGKKFRFSISLDLQPKEVFEDTKRVIKIRKSKKNRQHNGQAQLLSLETSTYLSLSKTNRCAPIRILYKDDRLLQFINLSTCNAPIIYTIKKRYKSITETAIDKEFDSGEDNIIHVCCFETDR